VRAGLLGLPLMVAIIGGEPRRFAPLIDLYRRAGAEAGHAPEVLKVGLHVFGYVGDSVQSAADTIYPGWHEMFTRVSKERGFATPTRAQFDATSGPDGAFFLGDPDVVATKLRRVSEQLGGIDRISIQMTNTRLAHADLLRGIEVLGTGVAPKVADV
jgi:alkanesulfonate monooxygenase SsuD/methylene tetrahydromethanopterin reductase-like flavin-dependent oxidoreductase (luciferase family)